MKSRLLLRSVEHAMSFVGALHAAGLRVSTSLLHRVAAAHKRLRRWTWPLLIRRTPFRRVVRLADTRRPIAGLRGLVTITEPWSVSIHDGPQRAFVDRTYDFEDGRLNLQGAFLATLNGAYLHTPTGLVCTAGSELVADSVKKIERHLDAAVGVDLSAARVWPGDCSTVMCKPHDNYYHWFNDCVLRLYLLHRRPERTPLTILVPPTLRPYQMQSLRYCLPENATIECVADPWVRVERLLLPSFITDPLVGMVPPESLAYVHRRIVGHVCGERSPETRRRVYISRASSGHRQIANEAELTEQLREWQFEIVAPERLSFEEQVTLFRAAEVIVGPRGAALTNMLFAERAKILELTTDVPFAGAVYFGLAYSMGHEYRHLFCRRKGGAYVVDPDAFRASLGDLLAA